MPKKQTITVCVDFDGVLHTYKHFQGVDVFREPIPGASEGMRELEKRGCFLILHTTRPDTPVLRGWLLEHNIPIHAFNENPNFVATGNTDPKKPIAHVYLDDRGVTFNGDWSSIVDTIMKFEPWYLR